MKVFKTRLIVVGAFLALCFCVLICRLFQIQVFKANEYSKISFRQSKQRTLITACRGSIRDQKGRVLAENIPNNSPAALFGEGAGHKAQSAPKRVYHPPLKRVYPYGELAGGVLGYVGKDDYGLAGIEYVVDQYLRGEDGWCIIQKDGRNNRYSRIGMPEKLPESGCDIYLTIDLEIQKIVEKVLAHTVKEFNAKGGMCIVLDPQTGAVLAMANEPSFNPNSWKQYPQERRKNNCIVYTYEPGSTFKVITAAIALQEEVKDEGDSINGNNGVYEIYNQIISDHKPFGKLTFAEALSYSSNVCFAKVAKELGGKRLYNYTKDFGFGSATGMSLPGEEPGVVHPLNKWSGRTLVTMAIGQELSVTLLQMITAFAAIANNGVLVEPSIIDRVVDSKGAVVMKSSLKVKRRVVSEATALRVRTMMKGVVDYGTGKQGGLPGISIGGKTGTSQKIDAETGAYSKDRVWSSFIGLAPAEKPVLVCGVMIDEPQTGELGGIVAAPAFRQIVQQIVSHPDLAYAEKLIHSDPADKCGKQERNRLYSLCRKLPDMRGLEKGSAAAFLALEKIPFEIIGGGNRIKYQSPLVGKALTSNTKLILYTDNQKSALPEGNNGAAYTAMPNCIGKDLRDAVNTLNLKGIVPYIQGTGVVKEQRPPFGGSFQSSAVCTLICSFEG